MNAVVSIEPTSLLVQLSDRRQFIVYRLQPKADGGLDKIPVDPMTGANLDAQNRDNWLLPFEAKLWADTYGAGYGVGAMIADGIACIDLDHCREPNGGWMPHVVSFEARFPGAYRETSVSGSGRHVFVSYQGELPAHGTRNKTYRMEAYTKARFIALTGHEAEGSILTDHTAALAAFLGDFFSAREERDAGAWTNEPVAQWRGPPNTPEGDVELIQIALRSQGIKSKLGIKAAFRDIWEANAHVLGRAYPSQNSHSSWDRSGADQALANWLAFLTGNHCDRMLRLMQSCAAQAREKWSRPDYLPRTILEACSKQTEWYSKETDTAPVVAEAPTPPAVPAPPAAPTGNTDVPSPPLPPSQSLRFLPETQVQHRLTTNSRDQWESTLPNLTFTLAKQELAVLGFDTFRGQVMIAPAADPTQWKALTDTDMVRLREALERQGFAAIGKELMRDALQKVAEDNSYDSAITWLNGLTWDGTSRIETFLPIYCGAADDEYTRAVGRYIWTGLAARVFEPGCQLDMVVAMQSKQGTRKSTGLQAIAPAPEYFTDGVSLQDDDSDFKRLIRGKLVIEIAELAGLSKADVDLVKRVITRKTEEWVEKWQTLPTSYKRRCMLFASTNNEQFLPQDDTGQRRWLPVEITMLDDQRIVADREQLWAEGAAIWRARKNAGLHGVDWQDAERLAAGRHKKYELSDVWEPLIEKWLNEPEIVLKDGKPLPAAPPRTRPLTINEILAGAVHLTAAQMDMRAEKRAGNAMRKLGFEKRSVRIEGRAHPVQRWVCSTL